jgi:hypothetical protein
VDKKSQPSDDAFDLLLAIANKESETMQGGAQYKIKAANLIITVTSNPNYLVLSYGNSSFKISKNIITFSGNLPLYVLDVITTVFRGESLINSKLLQSVLEEQNYFINKFGKYVDRGKRDESISEKSFASLQKHFYNTLNLCLICGDENLCTQTLGLMLSVLGKIVDESVSFRDSAMMQMALAKMTRTLLECFPNFPKLADLTEREMENFNALCSIADFSLGARPSNATAD